MVRIVWSKPQELPPPAEMPELETATEPNQFVFKMSSIGTPDAKQSEAFIATTALFLTFGASAKEEKVSLRLPAVWRDIWTEFADARKSRADAVDRDTIKRLRAMVRERQDQELEDGILAFRGRGAGRNVNDSGDDSGTDRGKLMNGGSPEYYRKIWQVKSSTPRYESMLESRRQLPMWPFRKKVLEAVDKSQVCSNSLILSRLRK